MTTKRKRRPGGGRKPQGEFAGKRAVLSTRITQETRNRLKAAARASGRSLSQEIEFRLRASFATAQQQDAQNRALGYLIGQMAAWIGPDWRTNPWLFDVLQKAIQYFLQQIRPAGAGSRPPWAEQVLTNVNRRQFFGPQSEWSMGPEALGTIVGGTVFGIMTITRDMPPGELAPDGSWPYAMRQAREALGTTLHEQSETLCLRRLGGAFRNLWPCFRSNLRECLWQAGMKWSAG